MYIHPSCLSISVTSFSSMHTLHDTFQLPNSRPLVDGSSLPQPHNHAEYSPNYRWPENGSTRDFQFAPDELPPGSANTAYTPGIVAGLDVSLVLVLGYCAYTRPRISSSSDNNGARSVAPRPQDTLTLQDLRSLLITLKVCGVSLRNPGSTALASNCSICSEPYLEGATLRRLPCGREFHQCCIDPWLLRQSATCPLWYLLKTL